MEYCAAVHEEHLLVASEMMEGICFSPCCLKLTTVVRWYFSLAIVLAREDVNVHLYAPETSTKHFWQCVWANCHLEKVCNCLGNNIWPVGCTWLPEMLTQSLAVIQPFRVVIVPAEYQDIVAQIIADTPPCFTVGTRQLIIDLLGSSAWWGEQHEGWLSDHITYFQSSDVQVLWSLYYLLRFLDLFSVIRGLTIAALPWMLDLWSSRRTVCEETGSSRWILSFAVTLAAAVLWFLDIILFNVRRFLSFSFVFRPLFLSADDVFSWSVYVGNCCSGYSWWSGLLVTDAARNAHLQSFLFENLTSLPFCSTFIRTVTDNL